MAFSIPDKGEAAHEIQSILFQAYIDVLVTGAAGVDCVLAGCAVSPNAGMQLAIAEGKVRSSSLLKTVAATNVTISAANVTYPRLDFVCVDSTGAVVVRAGNAVSNPKPPEKAVGDVVLAAIFVPANDTYIALNQIVDMRVISGGVNSTHITPAAFGAQGNGADDTTALQNMLDSVKNLTINLTSEALATAGLLTLDPIVIDLAGGKYKVSSKLDFADLYNITIQNGRIYANSGVSWGSDPILYVAKPQVADILRDQKIRNLTFKNVHLDGRTVANGAYFENTYGVTLEDVVAIGWPNTVGYGFKTSVGSGSPKTKNTHLTFTRVVASQKELAAIMTDGSTTTSGLGFGIYTADFVLNTCVAFGADVGFDFDSVYNGQVLGCHSFCKAAQVCLRVGSAMHNLAVTNFYADTGLVEIRSFSHTFCGCEFVAGSQVNFITSTAGEDCAGLVVTGNLFDNQPQYLSESGGTWASNFKSQWAGNIRTDGARIFGLGRANFHRGTVSYPAICFNDMTSCDTSTGFYSPATGEVAFSCGGVLLYVHDSAGRTIYGHSANIQQVAGSGPKIQLHGLTGNNSTHTTTRWTSSADGASGGGGKYSVGRSKSDTIGSYSAIQSGDDLGGYYFHGDSGATLNNIGGWVRAEAAANWTAGSAAANVIIGSTPAGSIIPTDRVVVESAGHLRPAANNAYSFGTGTHRWTEIFATNGTINTSDSREKTDIADATLGLDFVQSLHSVSYRWKVGHNKIDTVVLKPAVVSSKGLLLKPEETEVVITPVPGVRTHFGFLAHEVKSALEAAGVADSGMWILTDKEDANSLQGLRYEQFIPVLVKAIQELADQVQKLKGVK